MSRVIVLGAGIAGVPAAYGLRERLGPEDQVTVVSDRDRFQFVPSNPWIAVGLRKVTDTEFPIGKQLRDRGIEFKVDPVARIDPEGGTVVLRSGDHLAYDYLVLATGVAPAWGAVKGVEPVGSIHSVIRLDEAVKAFEAYQRFLTNPGPIVVAATQNASILGPVYEYAFLIDADLRRRGIRGRVPITLITPEPYPGHLGLGNDSVRQPLEKALASSNIQWIGNAETVAVDAKTVNLRVHGSAGAQSQEIAFEYGMYWPEFRGTDACCASTDLCDEQGFLPVNDQLQARGFPNVFGVGTCVARVSTAQTPVPIGMPDSVYAIQQEVDAAVHNVVASKEHRALISARPARAQWIEDMGPHGATYLSAPQIPLRTINWLLAGRWVYQAKRELEDYFIEQVVLGSGTRGHVSQAVERWIAQKVDEGRTPKPAQRITIFLDEGRRHRLQGLARMAGMDVQTLTLELIDAALDDAMGALGHDEQERLTRYQRESLVTALSVEANAVAFEGGAP